VNLFYLHTFCFYSSSSSITRLFSSLFYSPHFSPYNGLRYICPCQCRCLLLVRTQLMLWSAYPESESISSALGFLICSENGENMFFGNGGNCLQATRCNQTRWDHGNTLNSSSGGTRFECMLRHQYPDWGVSLFCSVLLGKYHDRLPLGHDKFLPSTLQFISELFYPSIWRYMF
jgi:hypothetical protein